MQCEQIVTALTGLMDGNSRATSGPEAIMRIVHTMPELWCLHGSTKAGRFFFQSSVLAIETLKLGSEAEWFNGLEPLSHRVKLLFFVKTWETNVEVALLMIRDEISTQRIERYVRVGMGRHIWRTGWKTHGVRWTGMLCVNVVTLGSDE